MIEWPWIIVAALSGCFIGHRFGWRGMMREWVKGLEADIANAEATGELTETEANRARLRLSKIAGQ